MSDSVDHSILALFPGQGSQSVGMGKALTETYPKARELFDRADQALGFSLSEICFNGPAEKLTLTEIAQPAILTVSTICFELSREQLGSNHKIVSAAGHSLGEYSALVAAGALSFEDAVVLVNKRGRYMQEAVASGKGKMLAVLGKEVSEIEAAAQGLAGGIVEIANINAPGQIVVAGDATAIEEFAAKIGGKTIPLPVSAPFHCSLMKPAEEKLAPDLAAVNFKACSWPIYANFSAQATTQPDQIRENLKKQVCGRVRWVECITNSIRDAKPTIALEFGAGSVLTGLMKRIDSQFKRVTINDPAALSEAFGA